MIILIKDCLTELVRTGSSADRYADHLLPADTAETGRRRSIEGERRRGRNLFRCALLFPGPPRAIRCPRAILRWRAIPSPCAFRLPAWGEGTSRHNTEQEQQVELLSAHCSPAMGVMGDAICQDTEDGEKLDAVEDSQEADTTKTERMVPSATGPVDREDGGHELDTNEAGGEDGKDCGETTSNAVRQDNKSSVIHITEVESGDGSCQENRPSFEGVIITVDGTPSDDNDDVQVTRRKPVQKPRKRGKVMIPQGRRVLTRSVTKEQHNDT
ncbi:hypothetical protein BHE74_00035627 [Ensete ventricosum]|nr:hypothetical protein BHE74_00035627 [Ensete ventricosum]